MAMKKREPFPWEVERANKLKQQIIEETTVEPNGALRWKASGNLVPVDCFEEAGLTPPAAQAASVRAENAEAIKAYKAARGKQGYSAEEMFEMRAAFGDGAEVVDIFTGKKTKL